MTVTPSVVLLRPKQSGLHQSMMKAALFLVLAGARARYLCPPIFTGIVICWPSRTTTTSTVLRGTAAPAR
jgi:hypothetical protein